MINLQAMAIGGVAIAAAAGFGGWTMHARGEAQRTAAAVQKAEERVKAAATKVVDDMLGEIRTLTTERDQARSEVAKVNEANAAGVAALNAKLDADLAQRQAATQRSEQAAATASRDLKALTTKVQATLEGLRNVADECAKAPLSPDARRMLNSVLSGQVP